MPRFYRKNKPKETNTKQKKKEEITPQVFFNNT